MAKHLTDRHPVFGDIYGFQPDFMQSLTAKDFPAIIIFNHHNYSCLFVKLLLSFGYNSFDPMLLSNYFAKFCSNHHMCNSANAYRPNCV